MAGFKIAKIKIDLTLIFLKCFLRLDEMSYGSFHVQYGFKNKVKG